MFEVKFNLKETELTMPSLLGLGFRREDITTLFEELQTKGFGVYTPGRRGKGCCARFEPNSNCPETYVVMSEKRQYNKKTDNVEEKSCDYVSNVETAQALWNLSKNIVKDISSPFVGYETEVFANAFLVLHRVRGGGEESIEKAIATTWDKVSQRVGNNKVVDVASALRGNGFFILDRM